VGGKVIKRERERERGRGWVGGGGGREKIPGIRSLVGALPIPSLLPISAATPL